MIETMQRLGYPEGYINYVTGGNGPSISDILEVVEQAGDSAATAGITTSSGKEGGADRHERQAESKHKSSSDKSTPNTRGSSHRGSKPVRKDEKEDRASREDNGSNSGGGTGRRGGSKVEEDTGSSTGTKKGASAETRGSWGWGGYTERTSGGASVR